MPSHFSVRDVTWACFEDGFWITATTDVPCHLWLRWSAKKPWIHSRPVERRGLRVTDDVRFCFTVYNDVEQKEPGDTLLHTFILTPWPVCETRWFYFWGYIAGEVSPSTSPIFKLHYDSDCPVIPPAPYVGTYLFYLHLVNRPQGELYIGLGIDDFEYSLVYHTIDYGNHWQPVLTTVPFGGKWHIPLMVIPTSAGFLALVWHRATAPWYFQVYRTWSLDAPWSVVLGGTGYSGLWRGYPDFWRSNGEDTIWCSGQTGTIAARPQLFVSFDGGLSWSICYTLGINAFPSQIRVNLSHTKGMIGTVTTAASTQNRWSNNPAATPGTWSSIGIYARAHRFGVAWPYVVLPSATNFWYSSDNGHTGVYKAIPAGMQTAANRRYNIGVDCCPSDHNRVLAAPPYAGRGIWLSKDFGDTWTKVHADLGAVLAPFFNSVKFDLFNPNVAYAWGKLGFFRSDDAGETWTARSNGLDLGQ